MISQMLGEVAARQAVIPWATCVGLVLFLLFFVGMLLWTGRSGGGALYQEISRLPLAPNDSSDEDRKEVKV